MNQVYRKRRKNVHKVGTGEALPSCLSIGWVHIREIEGQEFFTWSYPSHTWEYAVFCSQCIGISREQCVLGIAFVHVFTIKLYN